MDPGLHGRTLVELNWREQFVVEIDAWLTVD
jgi:hypothetical protein